MVFHLNQKVMSQREIHHGAVTRQADITCVLLAVKCYEPSSEESVYLEWLQHVHLRASLIGECTEAPIGKEHAESEHEPKAASLVERCLLILAQIRARCRRAVRELDIRSKLTSSHTCLKLLL